MTEKEAIEIINDVTWKDFGRHPDFPEARDVAKAALEKQIAISREIKDGEYFCPRCKYVMRHPGYCRKCGQHAY